MAAHVISHRPPDGKHARRSPHRRRSARRSLALRRFGAVAVTLTALAAASWLASHLYRAPVPIHPPETVAPPLSIGNGAPPWLIEAERPTDAPPTGARRPPRARASVPLNAPAASDGEDFEILSTDELDAISQARE